MNIVCIGGGPSGLYFALLMKQQDASHEITVVERNRPYDTFGWGVVFSDQTLGNLQSADPSSAAQILDAFSHWDDIEVNIRGHKLRSGGHGFCGIGRKRLLNILQRRCEALGVKLIFETDVQGDEQYPHADLIIASDGLNSRIRARYAATYRPDVDMRLCRWAVSLRRPMPEDRSSSPPELELTPVELQQGNACTSWPPTPQRRWPRPWEAGQHRVAGALHRALAASWMACAHRPCRLALRQPSRRWCARGSDLVPSPPARP